MDENALGRGEVTREIVLDQLQQCRFSLILLETVCITGRVHKDQVDKYLGKKKKSGASYHSQTTIARWYTHTTIFLLSSEQDLITWLSPVMSAWALQLFAVSPHHSSALSSVSFPVILVLAHTVLHLDLERAVGELRISQPHRLVGGGLSDWNRIDLALRGPSRRGQGRRAISSCRRSRHRSVAHVGCSPDFRKSRMMLGALVGPDSSPSPSSSPGSFPLGAT